MKSPSPIFLQGILFRSGTNYLARLLELHPDCVLSPIPEDWLLANSSHITQFVDAVTARWTRDPQWGIDPEKGEHLIEHLGNAMVSFLYAQSGNTKGQKLLTKTPDVTELPNFFSLFPDAHLLVLVRDGRSVVESTVRSFGFPPHHVARWWASAADRVIDFQPAQKPGNRRYRMVRYEDLVCEPAREMSEILSFLGLAAETYDFQGIEKMPVFGSSNTRNESGHWEWKISDDSGNLGALERWSGWSRNQHERFNWIAGKQLTKLGYSEVRFSDRKWLWSCKKIVWSVEDSLRRAYAMLTGNPKFRR
jgi:hypothetical protein